MVLLFELLRQCEWRFAVALIGSKYDAKVLKKFSTPFSMALGEQLMSSLTLDQGMRQRVCLCTAFVPLNVRVVYCVCTSLCNVS